MNYHTYHGKYRIPSARLQNWDYSNEGAYFITICTKDKVHLFGEIENGAMVLSKVGIIADILWYEIKYHTRNVEVGEFVVMPNHIHGIVLLKSNEQNTINNPGRITPVETLHATSLQHPPIINRKMASISPKSNTISTIIRSYKSAVTRHARRLGYEMEWQTRFYDHIIRNPASFVKIANYIVNNPANWKEDKFYD
ncbi:MAG: transposase [Candidatus Kapaibacterium sp.]